MQQYVYIFEKSSFELNNYYLKKIIITLTVWNFHFIFLI